ncbi:MAG: glycine--tRNA ligase subunit beta [Pseudomonadota bacterium]|nr:glycine--tRNA ligase subunit beta [Pseudomonadota bacterium]
MSEEVPARMQARARSDLARMFAEQLAAGGLRHDGIVTYSTPRRLALIARGLPLATEAVSEELKGPRTSAPPQALEGFLRKTGLSQDQLEDRDGVWFAKVEKAGRATAEVLAEAVAAIVRDFAWPKSMRWGEASASTASLRWVRPLHSIVALLGEEIVPVVIDGVACGAATLGHRFHHPGQITIGGAHDYVEKLRACHVIVDHEEREAIIRSGAIEAAENAGFLLVEDEGLVVENAGLTEWPVPLLGSFDPDFLDVPPEVIALTARTNQKYFVMRDAADKLAPHFVCVANISANDDGAAIVAGNERVLAARLSDARFFWQQDLGRSLSELAAGLVRSVFFEGLGTYREKASRIAELAAHISTHYVTGVNAQKAGQAAELAKADLISGTVGEFPELQGIVGGYLARDLEEEQAEAIAFQYRDDPPRAMAQVVGLADRLDTLVAFFARGQKPTGSKDPFALRRAAIQFIKIVTDNSLRVPLTKLFRKAEEGLTYDKQGLVGGLDTNDLLDFFADRLKVQQREAGVRHDLIDAVFALGGEDDLVRLLARVTALQAFVETQEGTNLLAGYKRAANILNKEKWTGKNGVMSVPGSQGISQTGEEDPLVLVEEPAIAEAVAKMAEAHRSREQISPEEAALREAVEQAEPLVSVALQTEDFGSAMTTLASLRAPIDAFFEKVIVNDLDADIRARRLNLLLRFRDAVDRVADFSKIEG